MTPLPPHRTLMLLHRLVDRALTPLLAPMGLDHATEGYVTISRQDIDALMGDAHGAGDPQAVLVGFGARTSASGVMIAEPALSSAVLSRIWRSDRNQGAPLTQVEGEILRQFLARIVGSWAESWSAEGIVLLPEFTMAGSLSMLAPQLADSAWHVARVVVHDREDETPLGVLLFCYPDAVMAQLAREARATMWRSRIDRGLSQREHARLAARLSGPLRDVVITAPVIVHQHVTLGMLNSLERGDVLAFDTDPAGSIELNMLDRTIRAGLAAHGEHLALTVTSPDAPGLSNAPAHAVSTPIDPTSSEFGRAYASASSELDLEHDPNHDFDLTA